MRSPRKTRPLPSRLVATLGTTVLAGALIGTAFVPAAAAKHAQHHDATVTSVTNGLPTGATAVTTTVTSQQETVSHVVMQRRGSAQELPTRLFQLSQGSSRMSGLTLDPADATGGTLPTGGDLPLAETVPTSGLPTGALSKINWILRQVGAGRGDASTFTAAADKLGDQAGLEENTPVTPRQGVAAAQAAVWHYSSGYELASERNDEVVVALYRYYTGQSNVGVPAQPAQLPVIQAPTPGHLPSAGDLPEALKDNAGQLIGPLELRDGVERAAVTVTGSASSTVVDGKGESVRTMTESQEYYLRLVEGSRSGQSVVTAVTSESQPSTGRVLSTVDGDEVRRELVIAGGDDLPAKQAAVVNYSLPEATHGASAVGLSPVCTAEGMGVNVDNSDGDEPAHVTVGGEDVTVPAGSTTVVPVEVGEGEAYDIEVTDASGTSHLTGVRNCGSALTPTITSTCVDEGLAIALANASAAEEMVVDVAGEPVTVPAGETETVTVPVTEADAPAIAITTDGFAQSLDPGTCADTATLADAASRSDDDSGLPLTGAAIGGLVAVGVLVFGGGLALFLMGRRRGATPGDA